MNPPADRRGSSPWGDPVPPTPGGVRRRPVASPYEPGGQNGRRPARSGGSAAAVGLADDRWGPAGTRGGAQRGDVSWSRPPARKRGPGRLFRATRASVALLVISLGLGLALASAFGLLFWAIASAIHHASS